MQWGPSKADVGGGDGGGVDEETGKGAIIRLFNLYLTCPVDRTTVAALSAVLEHTAAIIVFFVVGCRDDGVCSSCSLERCCRQPCCRTTETDSTL